MTKQCTLIIQSLESTFDQNEQATQKVDSRVWEVSLGEI